MTDNTTLETPQASPSPPRAAVRLIRETAAALGIGVEGFCGDWVLRLTGAGGRTRLVWGYNFDLNPSAGAHVAKDKAATFEVLRAAGVPAVEHRLFLRADLQGYVSDTGNWRAMLAAFEAFGGDAVIKPAEGSGGAGVSRVRSGRELEQAAGGLWQRHHAICLGPFVPIAREVRFILLDGQARIVYEKDIDALSGDGRSSIGELILARARDDRQRWAPGLVAAARAQADWDRIPPEGERLPLAWKHNLRGARARPLEKPPGAMQELAVQASRALGLRLCAVDVIEAIGSEGARGPAVLEVNAGLMLERYVEQVPEGWVRASELMRDVLERMFA